MPVDVVVDVVVGKDKLSFWNDLILSLVLSTISIA
jgi:hypothetical protein